MTRPRPLVIGVAVVAIALVLAGLMVFRALNQPDRTATSTPSTSGTSPVPDASASPTQASPDAQPTTQAPTPTSAPSVDCPTPNYNGDRSSIENRAFDFVEASMLVDPIKRREALETTGTPPRLITADYFEEELSEALPADVGGGDLTFIIERAPDRIDATPIDKAHMSVIIASPKWTSCRDGKVVNVWAEPDVFITTSWTLLNNVWYAEPGQA